MNRKIIFIIAIIGFLVFGNGVLNGFVRDDFLQIVNNANVHSLVNLPKLFTGSTFYAGGSLKLTGVYYKPILNTIFSFMYVLFGQNPQAFHVLQILLHIATAVFIFLFFAGIIDKIIAFWLTLIFLVHPINSESVLYISGLQEVLFTLFGMVGLWIIQKYRSRRSLILAGLLLILSLFSKETGILFLVMSFLYAFVKDQKNKRILFLTLCVGFIGYLMFRQNAVGLINNPLNAPITKIALQYRLVMVPAILLFYLKSFIFPLHLSSSYQWVYTSLTFSHFAIPLIIDLVVFLALFLIAFQIHSKPSRRYYFFFYFWFITGLLFHAQIVPLDGTVSERWFYFPIIGLLGMIGVTLHEVLNNNMKQIGAVIVFIVIAILSVRTIVRTFDWRNDLTLARQDITVSKNAYDLENVLAIELLKQGQLDDAKTYALRSVGDFPSVTNYNILGLVYLNTREYDKAKQAFLTGLTYGNYYVLYDNLAGILLMTGDAGGNVKFFLDAVLMYPNDSKLWLTLAIVYYQQNDSEDAKKAISRAYALDQSPSTTSFYETIMHDQPLNLNFKTR